MPAVFFALGKDTNTAQAQNRVICPLRAWLCLWVLQRQDEGCRGCGERRFPVSALRNGSKSHLTENTLAFKMLRIRFNRPLSIDFAQSCLSILYFIMHVKKSIL